MILIFNELKRLDTRGAVFNDLHEATHQTTTADELQGIINSLVASGEIRAVNFPANVVYFLPDAWTKREATRMSEAEKKPIYVQDFEAIFKDMSGREIINYLFSKDGEPQTPTAAFIAAGRTLAFFEYFKTEAIQ